jgi:hypothetical protein
MSGARFQTLKRNSVVAFANLAHYPLVLVTALFGLALVTGQTGGIA